MNMFDTVSTTIPDNSKLEGCEPLGETSTVRADRHVPQLQPRGGVQTTAVTLPLLENLLLKRGCQVGEIMNNR